MGWRSRAQDCAARKEATEHKEFTRYCLRFYPCPFFRFNTLVRKILISRHCELQKDFSLIKMTILICRTCRYESTRHEAKSMIYSKDVHLWILKWLLGSSMPLRLNPLLHQYTLEELAVAQFSIEASIARPSREDVSVPSA